MVQLEELGLLKMDFLGLRTLTVLKDAVKNVKASQGIDIDIDHIDLNDKKVLDLSEPGAPRVCSSWNLRACRTS